MEVKTGKYRIRRGEQRSSTAQLEIDIQYGSLINCRLDVSLNSQKNFLYSVATTSLLINRKGTGLRLRH